MRNKPLKFNRFYHGFFGGLIITSVVFALFAIFNWSRFETWNKFVIYLSYGQMISSLISLCAVPNLILFFYFMKTDRYYAGKGLIAITMLTAIVVFILRAYRLG
ncbi:MAG: hypothetical protein RBR35_05685 [Salinivirgaceae bacterium]|nr:hypothetical protein [Salinivirgaceae bacterium]